MSEPAPTDLGMESIPVIQIVTPPPAPASLPTPRDWPPAIEITAPPTDTEAFTTLTYGPDPTAVFLVGLLFVVTAMQFILMRYHGRRR